MVRALLIGLSSLALVAGAAMERRLEADMDVQAGVAHSSMNEEWREQIVQDLRPGDLVFRRGRGGVSDAIALASGSGRAWTHVGIVVRLPTSADAFVLHAIDGRGVVMDAPQRFFSTIEADAGVVVRLRSDLGPAAAQHALTYKGRPFDPALAMSEQDRLYCTELVVVALRAAGAAIAPPLRSLPLVSEPVVMPDDLAAVLLNGDTYGTARKHSARTTSEPRGTLAGQ